MTLSARTTIYKNSYVYTTVEAPDAVVDGATVTVKEGSATRGTGKLVKGFVEVKVGAKIKKGTHTCTVSYPGTSTTTAVTKTVALVVK